MALRTIGVRLTAEVSDYQRKMTSAGGYTREFVGEMDKAAKSGHLDTVANKAGIAGLGLAGLAGAAVKMSMDFEKSMSAVSAATHASAGDIAKLRAAALQAGKDTQYSATEAADGITELGKAGVGTADILNGGLKGALSLAAAGQLGVGEAAETAASAMTQFGLSGAEVPHVADLLAAAAGKAQGSVHDMGYALKQSGLVAHQFGVPIEDATGSLAAFANAGLIGSDAGTSFKTMLIALAHPSEQTSKLMDKMGFSAYDAQGNFIGMTKLAGELQKELGGLSQEERNAALAQIFGNDAIRAGSILYEQGADGIQKWIDKTNDAGYAQQTAAKLTDNLAGDLERLRGSLETVAIQSGSGTTEGLRNLAKGANSAVDAFAELPGWVQQSVTVLSGIGGASLLAVAGFIKARSTARDFMTELENMGPRGAAAASGLSRLGSIAGKLSLVGVAAVGVYEGFKLFSDWAAERTAPAKANIDKLTESIREFAATGKATGELASKYGDSLQRIGQDVNAVIKGMADLKQAQADVAAGMSDPSLYANWNPVDPQVVQRVKDLDSALTRMVTAGGASQARIFLDKLRASGNLTAAQFDQLIGMLPNYTGAAKGAAAANTGLAKGFGDAKANAQTLTGTLESATGAGQKLTDVWNQLHGSLVSTDKAMLSANEAIQDVKKSFHENKNAIDGNSTAALKNRIAVGSAAKAAAEAAQAKFEETGSVKEANKVYDGYMGQLRKTLTQSGLTKKEVDKLIGAYGDMPRSVNTKVSITGDEAARVKLAALSIQQAALKKGMPISASAARALAGDEKAARQRGLFHDGGRTGNLGEWEPAGIVHGKEMVLNAKTVRKVDQQAPGFLDEMHATGQLPGYAGGGRVTWPFPVTASMTRIPSKAEAMAAVTPSFGHWPSSPSAQRGDSGVWRSVVALIKSTGPMSGHFGNAYRPGDPLWHGSGRAVDWMGYNQDRLASFLAARHPLELIHRTRQRDYAYTRGVNKGSFNNALMQAHRNHVHIAMKNGGTITEPIVGMGASGRTYSFGENYQPERVTPNWQAGGSGGAQVTFSPVFTGPVGSRYELQQWLVSALDSIKGRF